MRSEFDESGAIAASIYNMLFMGCLIFPLVFGLDVDYKASFVLSSREWWELVTCYMRHAYSCIHVT